MKYVLVFFIGSVISSCINVIAIRIVRNQNFILDHSRCPNCSHQLSYIDMIPIIGFILLKGKCKYCGNKIDIRYFIVEIIGGINSWVCFKYYNEWYYLLFSFLLFISLIDIEIQEIKDRYQLIIFINILIILVIEQRNIWVSMINGFLLPFILWVISQLNHQMGGADIKLLFSLSVLQGIKKSLVGFVISLIIGLIGSVLLIINKKRDKTQEIPFIPYICIGYLISMIYGEKIAEIYIKILFF